MTVALLEQNSAKMLEELIAPVLRGEGVPWPSSMDEQDQARLLAIMRDHGILPLFNEKLRESGAHIGLPESLLASLQRHSLIQAAYKANLELELQNILRLLSEASISPLIFKGAALAYTHYPAPHLRPHEDVDLLIMKDELDIVEPIMERLGYARSNLIRSELVSHQVLFSRVDGARFGLDLDFHWKVSNRYLLSDCLSLVELREQATLVPALGQEAYAPGTAHALFLACLHRIAHHLDSEQLIWLYDIHLLASRLSGRSWTEFERLARKKKIYAICRDGLISARKFFNTTLPESLDFGSIMPGKAGIHEPSERYIGSSLGKLHVFLLDFRDMPMAQKIRLLRDVSFPVPEKLRKRYGVSNRLSLPLLYLIRIASIIRTFLRNLPWHKE